jgi:hypothetical protein
MSEHKVKLNLHHSPPDRRDYKIKIKAPKPLKFNNVDLSNFCTSVKDQGAIGSCTAFAVVGLMEYIHKRAVNDGTEDIYSEKFTYYDTRVNQLGWSAAEDTGAYLRNAMASVVVSGAAPEAEFPYNNLHSEIPSPAVFESAQKNQVITYAKVPEDGDRQATLDACLQLLQEGYPLVGGFVCYDSLWSAQNGVLAPPGGTIIGGHAILIVGYDEGKRLFKFKNSWSPAWGDNGYGYLPYEYALNGDLWDLWTVFSQENFSDNEVIDIEKPSPEDDSKQITDDKIKAWASIVKIGQDIHDEVQAHADLDKMLVQCFETLNALQASITMVQSQSTLHKQHLEQKIAELNKKVLECYEMMTS